MRVKDKVQFVLGITNIILSIILSVVAILQHKEDKFIVVIFALFCGIMTLCNSIETKKQRRKKRRGIQTDDSILVWRGR